MYLPASLACTCSITSAQLVGFWTTMEYLGSPVKVALSRVSRSMVELPLSTDQDTVVACSQYLQSSLDIPYFDTEQRHSTDSSTVHTAGTTTSHQPSSDCVSVGTRQCPAVTCFIQILQCSATLSPMLATTRLLFTELSSNLGSTLRAAATGSPAAAAHTRSQDKYSSVSPFTLLFCCFEKLSFIRWQKYELP